MIELGRTYKDKITGFKGCATAHATYLSGCHQTLLAPPVAADGTFKDGQWFDDQRMALDADVEKVALDNGDTPGFDKPAPKR